MSEKSKSAPDFIDALQKSRQQQSFGEYIENYINRVKSGDIGSLPIIIGLIVIALIFQSQNANYLTPRNLVNLIVQASIFTTIGYGIVLVLLLGEIDLSAGYTAGVSAVIVGRLLERPLDLSSFGIADPVIVPWFVAMGVALLVTLLIGLLQGSIISGFQLPSFIVTLAGQLAWSGVVLLMMGGAGTVNIRNETVLGVTRSFFPPAWGWLLGFLLVATLALNEFLSYRSRAKMGLSTKPPQAIILQMVILSAVTFAFIAVANQDRGVPFIGLIVLLMMAVLTYVATQTRFGRYIFAVGGNKEAARRAGIRVEAIRIRVFMLCSLMAGFGGIILASRLGSVAPDAGGGQLLLNSIAAPVIGGTSLYGGSGKVSSAFFGALVIASVDNGMFLLGLGAGQRLILTAIVLIVAVVVDAVARRRQQASGRR
ncbi:MAG: ABC transporter permease [Anaerolineae bacterium]|nr:ABC transporter permease [Anaerolineae bacterium]MDW8170916.1 ABC transporter permease [Anaerolineae bacterium]